MRSQQPSQTKLSITSSKNMVSFKLTALLALAGFASAGPISDPLFFEGNATVFTPQPTGLTACGYTGLTPADVVAGVAKSFFDQHQPAGDNNPHDNTLCGREIEVHYQGKIIQAKIVEECAGCTSQFDMILSTGAFSQLADPTVGTIEVLWRLE